MIFNRKQKRKQKSLFGDYPWILVHRNGCRGISFYFKGKVGEAAIMAHEIKYPSGKIPGVKDLCLCGSCGRPLSIDDLQPDKFERIH